MRISALNNSTSNSKTFLTCLRLRYVFVKNDWVCHVWCNFLPGYTSWTTIIFGTMKDDSLPINTLTSSYCFRHRKVFQNGANSFSKMVNHLLPKILKMSYISYGTIGSNFTSMLSNNIWRDFRLSISASLMATINFCSKIAIKVFSATISNAYTGSLNFYHTLFNTYLDNFLAKFQPNRMVQNEQILSVLTKTGIFKTIFNKAFTPFCKTFCSWNNYSMVNY